MQLMLLSNSGQPYLEYASDRIVDFLGPEARYGFVSAARLGGPDAEALYFAQARDALSRPHNEVVHLKWEHDGTELVENIDGVFVGGGNTFALLSRLKKSGLFEAIGGLVRRGLRYVGSSAGSNITGPTILTTNDWNVTGETDFEALGFVPWNINPHYFPADGTGLPHTAQREPRIGEYHIVHTNPVLAIEEETGVFVDASGARLFGKGRAKIFWKDGACEWFGTGQWIPLE